MASENPIQGLYDEYLKIIHGSIIKYSYLADESEGLEMRRYVDTYLDAYYGYDTFELYTYDTNDYINAGINDAALISSYINDPSSVPKSLKQTLLQNRRNEVINSYEERNNYYRMLHGLPDLDDGEFVYVDYDTCITYGIDPTVPVHLIQDQLGDHYINALETIGYVDKLIEENPDKEYLKYLGTKRIDIVTARKAKNFQILYLDNSIPESIRDLFTTLYEQCREYFMTTIYIYDYRSVIEYYDRFIALCIMVMALQQLTARSLEAAIDRDFFDSHAIQALYEEYDIPFYATLDEKTQKAICQNINMLIQNKGTNKVIYDIGSLLGFSRIEIYRYYLMKEHIMDSDGKPLFIKKQEFNEDTGSYEEVYDYERMYDVYFQKVELNDYDYHEALEDSSNRVSYESVTSGDPYWVEDDELYKEVWESEYNYKETKYLGVTVSYKLSELLYENILLFRMIFDQKDNIPEITLKLPSISGDLSVSLFDTIVLLCALTSKKYGLQGEIVSKPSQVISVLNSLTRLYKPYETMNETFAFNFDWFTHENYQELTEELYQYMTYSEIKEFEEYIRILTITGTTNAEKINAINSMYANIKGLSKFLSDRMMAATDIDEYRMFNRYFRALYYSKETDDMFQISDGAGSTKAASTFLEYLLYTNPTLADFVETTERDECHLYIDHIINRMEAILNDLSCLYLINNATSSLQEVLIDLIRFFKSYTTDMIGLNIVYIFDFKPDNMLKLIDRMEKIIKRMEPYDTLYFRYADAVSHMKSTVTINEPMYIWDYIESHITFRLIEYLSFEEYLRLIKELEAHDSFTIQDMIHINTSSNESDYLNMWRDLIHYIHSEKLLSDSVEFFDKVLLKKYGFTSDSLGIFDICRVNKDLLIEDYQLMIHDACYVVENE